MLRRLSWRRGDLPRFRVARLEELLLSMNGIRVPSNRAATLGYRRILKVHAATCTRHFCIYPFSWIDWERKVRMIKVILGELSASNTFNASSLVVNNFSVTPIVTPSPKAAQRTFSVLPTPTRILPVQSPKNHDDDGVIELSSDSSEDEDVVLLQKIKPTVQKATPLYDRLKGAKDEEIKRWIGREEMGSLRAKGYFCPETPGLPPLSPAALQQVQQVWSTPGQQVVSEVGDIPLKPDDLRRFRGKTWLNDECINAYLQLIQLRSPDTIHCFNTFFYANLSKNGYGSVQRWTRRFDLFSLALCLIPVHLGMHWTMAAIDFQAKRIFYIDSFHAGNQRCLQDLWAYLEQEHRDKKGTDWDSTGWTAQCLTEGIPMQMNGYDCGVFACVFAELMARRAPFTFSQADMPYFRHRITYELLTKSFI